MNYRKIDPGAMQKAHETSVNRDHAAARKISEIPQKSSRCGMTTAIGLRFEADFNTLWTDLKLSGL
jgi:hypothetical protein